MNIKNNYICKRCNKNFTTNHNLKRHTNNCNNFAPSTSWPPSWASWLPMRTLIITSIEKSSFHTKRKSAEKSKLWFFSAPWHWCHDRKNALSDFSKVKNDSSFLLFGSCTFIRFNSDGPDPRITLQTAPLFSIHFKTQYIRLNPQSQDSTDSFLWFYSP